MTTRSVTAAPRGLRPVAVALAVLLVVILVFAVIRVAADWPHILDGSVPDDDFAERYVAHPWLGYLHIAPGVVYLLGAPLQLSRRFRTRHYTVHRRLGRVLLSCALLSGVLALAVGVVMPWGGLLETTAALLFGAWFVTCLVLAFAAIRRDDVPRHRRWMVRAFAVGIGIGTIRLWVGVFTAVILFQNGGGEGLTFPERTSFGVAFWLALSMHVVLGEWWLRRTPALDG